MEIEEHAMVQAINDSPDTKLQETDVRFEQNIAVCTIGLDLDDYS